MLRPSGSGLTVLIVEDHDAVRRALCETMRARFGRVVVHEARALREVSGLGACDVVLLDVATPEHQRIADARTLLQTWPRCRVILVTTLPASQATARAEENILFISRTDMRKRLGDVVALAIRTQATGRGVRFPAQGHRVRLRAGLRKRRTG